MTPREILGLCCVHVPHVRGILWLCGVHFCKLMTHPAVYLAIMLKVSCHTAEGN